MEKKQTRKPFVEPRLQAQASLVNVTLISGGSPTNGQVAKRTNKNPGLAARQGSNNRNA